MIVLEAGSFFQKLEKYATTRIITIDETDMEMAIESDFGDGVRAWSVIPIVLPSGPAAANGDSAEVATKSAMENP